MQSSSASSQLHREQQQRIDKLEAKVKTRDSTISALEKENDVLRGEIFELSLRLSEVGEGVFSLSDGSFHAKSNFDFDDFLENPDASDKLSPSHSDFASRGACDYSPSGGCGPVQVQKQGATDPTASAESLSGALSPDTSSSEGGHSCEGNAESLTDGDKLSNVSATSRVGVRGGCGAGGGSNSSAGAPAGVENGCSAASINGNSGSSSGAGGRPDSSKHNDSKKLGLVAELPGHTGAVYALKFSNGGDWICSGGFDSKVKIWDSKSNVEITSLSGHGQLVSCLAVNDTTVVSGSYDRTVRCNTV